MRVLCACAILLAVACGGESVTTTDPALRVTTVQIGGTPTGPTLVGGTVQLVATPLNASGAVVASQSVTWASSDQTIATVSSTGLVSALRAGTPTITATSGSGTGSVTLDLRGGGPVDAAGATLTALDGAVTLVIPPGALAQATTLLIRPVAGVTDPKIVGVTAVEIGPDNVSLTRGGTLRITYDPKKLAAGTAESSLQIYLLQNGAWGPINASTVNTTTHVVTGGFPRPGSYAIGVTAVKNLVMGGALASGALYLGHSGTLVATAYDANFFAIPSRTITWTSSNPAVARVDSTGLVTGVALGTATISATADGRSATTEVPVLPAPVASWSQATEWSTFQGDGRHTGAISATLDPAGFRELFTAAGIRGPVTLGDGKVYGIFKTSVVALDARTGAQQWTKDLGARDSYDPPAYGAGAVFVQTGGPANSFITAMSSADGILRWRTAYDNDSHLWYAPVVVGQSVFVASGHQGGLEAYDATTGVRSWVYPTNPYDLWTPAVADGLVYAYTGLDSPKLSVVDATTGKASFEIPDPGYKWTGWSMNLAPVLGAQSDVIAQQGTRLVSFDLAARKVRWQVTGWVSPYPSNWQVTVGGGVIYAFNGTQVEARSEADGSLQWAWPLPGDNEPVGTMIVTSNLLFVSAAVPGASTGITYALDLASHQKVWSYPASGQLAIGANGVLYISTKAQSLVGIALR